MKKEKSVSKIEESQNEDSMKESVIEESPARRSTTPAPEAEVKSPLKIDVSNASASALGSSGA